MAGAGYGNIGLAVASYEWVAAITLVFVALFLLPKFLRSGIYTIPEFLEYRYSPGTRTIMSVYMLIMYVLVAIASILYSGAIGLQAIFGLDLTYGVWLIGILAAAYTIYGGLKAVVWSDLLQGAALLIGGAIVMVLGFQAVGGVGAFFEANEDKLHMVLPADHPEIPWTALLIGIWIPNIFYWGLNQFITQRTLGAKSLSQGQNGIILAAFIKLLIPFIIVFPGIMALQLYASEIGDKQDQAYPILFAHVLPTGLRGIMFAALFGAVMSSLDSMLNSASTIFTVDIFKRRLRPDISPHAMVTIGRIATAVCVVIGCTMAPFLDNPKFGGIFKYIQMFQGFISPGIVTAFLFGLIVKKAPPAAAISALILNIPVYGVLLRLRGDIPFLNHMAITFGVLVAAMTVVTLISSIRKSLEMPVRDLLGLKVITYVKGLAALGILVYVSSALARVLLGVPIDRVQLWRGVDHPFFAGFAEITFFLLTVVLVAITLLFPEKERRELPVNKDFDLRSSPLVKVLGAVVVALSIALYVIFW
jgi:SSS family solute:Na+ symporter